MIILLNYLIILCHSDFNMKMQKIYEPCRKVKLHSQIINEILVILMKLGVILISKIFKYFEMEKNQAHAPIKDLYQFNHCHV